ncbi:MAG: Cytochrome c, class [Betaproteobacteria bacterium]|nr:Cytochrome c, class [Betaproteobacteria bacterium]
MIYVHRLIARAAAAVLAVALPGVAIAADAAAGMQKAQVCIACHGPEGVSATPAIPSLAGQPAQFIATQLLMFREGKRKDPQMSPFAANLTNTDLNNIAAYFTAQKLTLPAVTADAAAAQTGANLARQLNCVQCHGPALLGQQHIPRLAGQQREYLRTQLRGFKASTRFDMDGQMTSAAQPLSDADIESLAAYLANLR